MYILIQQIATAYKQKLINHPNELVTSLINNEGEIRRRDQKRIKLLDN